jgi:hypothetical protein
MLEEADLIFSYSRADAIRDGVLIDVSSRAKTLGYRYSGCAHCGTPRPPECWRK